MNQDALAVRAEQWRRIVTDCINRDPKISKRQWCRENGILPKTFYYRLRVLREEACSLMNLESNKSAVKPEPEFVRVGFPNAVNASGIRIKLDSAEISISPDASNEHVRMVLEAIAHA